MWVAVILFVSLKKKALIKETWMLCWVDWLVLGGWVGKGFGLCVFVRGRRVSCFRDSFLRNIAFVNIERNAPNIYGVKGIFNI